MAKHIKDPLPQWFNKENYLACKNYKLRHWWIDIGRRKSIYDHIQNTEDWVIYSLSQPSSINPEYYHILDTERFMGLAQKAVDIKSKQQGFDGHVVSTPEFKYLELVVEFTPIEKLLEERIIIITAVHMFEELVDTPIIFEALQNNHSHNNISTKHFSFKSKYHNPCLNIKNESEEFYTSSIKPITWKDTRFINDEWNRHPNIEEAVYHSWRTNMEGDDEELCKKALKPIDFDIPQMELAHVTLNLSASDPQILKDIKTFLKLYRKKLNDNESVPKFITETKLDKFYRYNLLAIMDLYLYGLLNNISIKKKYGVGNLADSVLFEDVIYDIIENTNNGDVNRFYQEQAKVNVIKILEDDVFYDSLLHQAF